MVVRDYLLEHPSKDIWLCPHLSSSSNLKPLKWEYGMSYSNMDNIPTEILNAQFVKGWVEEESAEMEGALCVIWKNWRVKNES